MAKVRKTVTFTEQQDRGIKAKIEAGEFSNNSEYIGNLVQQDQANNTKFLSLKQN